MGGLRQRLLRVIDLFSEWEIDLSSFRSAWFYVVGYMSPCALVRFYRGVFMFGSEIFTYMSSDTHGKIHLSPGVRTLDQFNKTNQTYFSSPIVREASITLRTLPILITQVDLVNIVPEELEESSNLLFDSLRSSRTIYFYTMSAE